MRAEDMQIRRGVSEVLRVPSRWRDVTFFAATLAADVSGPQPSRFRLEGLPVTSCSCVYCLPGRHVYVSWGYVLLFFSLRSPSRFEPRSFTL